MKIIKPGYEFITPSEFTPENIRSIYKRIERAGRTCYKSEDRITDDSASKFVAAMVRNGHEAMLEHADMTIKFIVDRGVSHELVRHRVASFAQESTRYCVAENSRLTFLNPHVHMTIEELYNNVCESHNGAWKRMKIKQYNEKTGGFEYANIKNVFFNGIQQCITIKTKLGYEITCTQKHEIYTRNGTKIAGELNIGDKIYVNGTNELYKNRDWLYMQNITLNKTFVQIGAEFGFNANTVKKWARKLEIPKKGTGYFNVGRSPWNKGIDDKRLSDALRKYHHCGRRKDKILKQDTTKYHKHAAECCCVCGATTNLHVHHIDKNRENNNPDNLITLCASCHLRVHSRNLEVAYEDEIIDIQESGERKVFDLEMNSEFHNYVANGVVVHNCSYNKDKFGGEITFIQPCYFEEGTSVYDEWWDVMNCSEHTYMLMLEQGVPPEQARSVLPNSVKTEVVMTANMREWRHFLKLRAAGMFGKPHPQMLEVAVPLLKELKEKMPELFNDIEPMELK